jgi:hypothetical protein
VGAKSAARAWDGSAWGVVGVRTMLGVGVGGARALRRFAGDVAPAKIEAAPGWRNWQTQRTQNGFSGLLTEVALSRQKLPNPNNDGPSIAILS